MWLQETFAIEDCVYYNDGGHTTGLTIDSGAVCTSNGSYLTISCSASSEKYVKVPFDVNGDFEYSFEVAEEGINAAYQWQVNNNVHYGNSGYSKLNNEYIYFTTSAPYKNGVFKLKSQNGVVKTYWKDVETASKTFNLTLTNAGFYINPNRTIYVKNIKIKAL